MVNTDYTSVHTEACMQAGGHTRNQIYNRGDRLDDIHTHIQLLYRHPHIHTHTFTETGRHGGHIYMHTSTYILAYKLTHIHAHFHAHRQACTQRAIETD